MNRITEEEAKSLLDSIHQSWSESGELTPELKESIKEVYSSTPQAIRLLFEFSKSLYMKQATSTRWTKEFFTLFGDQKFVGVE